MRWIGALLVIAACHGGGGATVDGSVEPPTDIRVDPGVHVSWSPTIAIPGVVDTVTTVSEVALTIEFIEAVSPQDTPILRNVDLEWGAGEQPDRSSMPDAKPGDYQLIKVKLNSAEIRGTWHNNRTNETLTYRIDTNGRFGSKQLPFGTKVLEAGSSLALGIDLDLAAAIKAVPFEMLRPRGPGPGPGPGDDDDQGEDEDDLEFDDGDPRIIGWCMAMTNAIRLHVDK